MNAPELPTTDISTPEDSGVEFGRGADDLLVARVGDLVFAMVPGRGSRHFLASAWRVSRPLDHLKRDDFYSHHGVLEDEAAFRARMFEQAEHSRELQLLRRQAIRMNCSTPWGSSQCATVYADGIVSHTTASHGGFKLSAERNAKVRPQLRSEGGWYEEDAAWAVVALTYPDLFTTYERKGADKTIRDAWPDAWESIYGRELGPGESYEKDRLAFHATHIGDWVVISALQSDHHSGMTEVIATIGGKRDGRASERRYLVASDDYRPGPFGFVIDDTCHATYDGPSAFAAEQRRTS